MITRQFDIAIIGAGPAGCAAALGLGRSGLKVALIDKSSYPREKICGDAIPGPAINSLNLLFPFFEPAFSKLKGKHRIRMSRIILENGRSISYYWKLPAYNIKRSIFDNFLLELVNEHTDTEILTGWHVKEIVDGDPVLIHAHKNSESISARMIIGCDGANSITSKAFQHPSSGIQSPVMAVRSYYKGLDLDSSTNFFYIFKKYLPGYFWAFPIGDGVSNVGLGVKTQKDGKAPIGMKDVLQEFITKSGISKDFERGEQITEVSGALLPVGGRKGEYSGNHYLLAGDAACLADPLQGHGIDKAIVSGLLAAHHSMKCFKENEFNAAFNTYYNLIIKNGIERELRKNRQRQVMLANFPALLKLYSYIKK